jgi:hypothetical protein
MADVQPNDRLASVMSEGNVSHKSLARAVRDVAARLGQASSCDHTSVSRWLHGMQPRGSTPEWIAEALSGRLRRRVTLTDIGMERPTERTLELGLGYADDASDAAALLARLWRADLDDVRSFVDATPQADAWAAASLKWLVRPDDELLPNRRIERRIGAADLEAVRATTAAFSSLDGHFGGRNGRSALVRYLHDDLLPMLRCGYSEAVGRRLHTVASEALLQAAWMTYDAGRHGLAQRYFIQALRLAQAAGDALLAGSVLDAMSHQATFVGRHKEAAELARSARVGTRGLAPPTLTAHFLMMEGRAVAASGDVTGTMRLLAEAERTFERGQPDNSPEWMAYFDNAELSAELAHCFRDIGRGADAVTYAGIALDAARGVSTRSDFFVTMVRADGLLAVGALEEACATAAEALVLSKQLKSVRCVEYLRAFRTRLAPHTRTPHYRLLEEVGAAIPMWFEDDQNGRH